MRKNGGQFSLAAEAVRTSQNRTTPTPGLYGRSLDRPWCHSLKAGLGIIGGGSTVNCPLQWIADHYDVYCLTLAKGLLGRDLLLRLSCDEAGMFTPTDEELVHEFLGEALEHYDSWGAVHAGQAGGWAFALEPASTWSSISERLEAASTGTEVICAFASGPLSYVEYWQDGTFVLRLDTLAPERRAEEGGTDPDRFLEEMRRVGFSRDGGVSHRHKGLALLHEITSVALTETETMLALTGRIPALHCGPEGIPEGSAGAVPGGAVIAKKVGALPEPKKIAARRVRQSPQSCPVSISSLVVGLTGQRLAFAVPPQWSARFSIDQATFACPGFPLPGSLASRSRPPH
ncbi:DUF6461 domain-containing protein [Streptomyces sp. NPDC052396]|uniref:DUF6461 domain-containing protein n=1 Tax=Streptomyces sp. NPDC052396 TaxID=3365689 RepID=UPI0037D9270C